MNFSGHVGHATIFRWMFTIACRAVVGLGLGLGSGLGYIWCLIGELLCFCATLGCNCHATFLKLLRL